MGKDKTYHKSSLGVVTQCGDCGCFELLFGTSLLRMEPEAFEVFCTMVERMLFFYEDDVTGCQKEIKITLSAGYAYLLLTAAELHQLHTILLDVQSELFLEALVD